MSQLEATPLDRAELNQTVQRCAAAYHRIMADMPQHVGYVSEQRHWHKASLAFIAELPLLLDPHSFHLYIACVAQGVGIGAIDIADAGRLCHLAQTAMSAWKLANLTVPEAREKERQAREKLPRAASAVPSPGSKTNSASIASSAVPRGEGQAAPPSPKGNQPPTLENPYASSKLPSWDVQTAHFSNLRTRGIEIPTDEELHADPAAALHWVETARRYMLAENVPARPAPSPLEAQPQQPTQAA